MLTSVALAEARHRARLVTLLGLLSAVFVIALALPGSALATPACSLASGQKLWTGGGGNHQWTTGANWSGGTVPGAAAHVCIPAGQGEVVVDNGGSSNISVADLESSSPLRVTDGTTFAVTSTTQGSSVHNTFTVDPFSVFSGNGAMTVDGGDGLHLAGSLEGAGATTVTAFDADDSTVTPVVGRNLTLNGPGTMNERLSFENGAVFTIGASGSLTDATDGQLDWTFVGSQPQINILAGGVLAKTDGVFDTTVDVPVDNDGTVKATSGRIAIDNGSGSGTSTGTWQATDGALIDFASGQERLGGGSTLTGAGNVRLNGGQVTLTAGTTTVDAASTFVAAFGTLDGAGSMTVNGTLHWSGGSTIAGTGTLAVPGTLAIDDDADTGTRVLGRNLTLSGTGTWSGEDGIFLESNAVVTVSGTLTVDNDNSVDDDGTGQLKVTSTGVVKKTGGGGEAFIQVPAENDGLVQADSGTLVFNEDGSGASGGTYTATDGNTIEFAAGQYNFDGSATFSGAGRIWNVSAELTLNAGATASVDAASTFEQTSGSIDGPGALTVNGTLLWDGGSSLDGTGTTTVPGTLKINSAVDAGTRSLGRKLTIPAGATAAWTGSVNLFLHDGGRLTDSGTLNVASAAGASDDGTGLISVTPTGSLTKTSGSGETDIDVALENDGQVTSSAGRLLLFGGSGAGASSGTWTASTASSRVILDGAQNVSGAHMTGPGRVAIEGGEFKIANSTTATVDAGATLELYGGTIDGPGALAVPGTLLWDGGASLSDTGTTTVSGTLKLSDAVNTGTKDIGRAFTLSGTGTWTGRDDVELHDANFQISGSLSAATDANWIDAGGTVTGQLKVLAGGSLSKTAGTGTLFIGSTFSNAGTVSSSHGTLDVNGTAVTNYNSTTSTLTGGTWNVTGSGRIGLPGPVLRNAATLGLDGTGGSRFVDDTTFPPADGLTAVNNNTGTINLTGGHNLTTNATTLTNTGSGRLDVGKDSTVHATGNYTQGASATLAVHVAGFNPGVNASHIVVDNKATLAGTLSVKTSVPFTPDKVLELMTTGSHVGTFATVPAGFVVDYGNPGKVLLRGAQTPSVNIEDVVTKEGNSGTTTVNVPVTLSGPSSQPVTITYQTARATGSSQIATAGEDYTAITASTLTFAPGETSKVIPVTINGDTREEGRENFLVKLSSPVNAALARTQAQVSLTDEETQPAAYIGDASVTEGNAGTTTAVFTVSLQHPADHPLSLQYQTGTTGVNPATAGTDYTAVAGATLSFSAGQQSKQVAVTVIGDTSVEPNEQFKVTLTNPSNDLAIGDNAGTGTIVDDDGGAPSPPRPALAVSDGYATEGSSGTRIMNFVVSLPSPQASDVTFNYKTTNGTAKSPSDFDGISTHLGTIPAGSTSTTIHVTINGDTLHEGDETFKLALSSPSSNVIIGDTSGLGTIVDEEGPLVAYVQDTGVLEGDSGDVSLDYTVQLSAAPASGQTASVAYATGSGTATAGSDYALTSGTLTFTDVTGASQTVSVPVHGDTATEPNETVPLDLSSPSGLSLGDTSSLGTIFDDD